MATAPIRVYGGVLPPQGVPVNLVHTALGLAVEGLNLRSDTLPIASSLPERVFANTTDKGLMVTKDGEWIEVEL